MRGHPKWAPTERLYVELTYDAPHTVFFPARIHPGNFSASVPTPLPTYRVYVMVE